MSIDNVEDLSPIKQYTAEAAQTDFDYTFPIFEDADLVVDVDGVAQALSTDYTVSGEGDDTGGTVTFLVAMTGGEVVTLYRDIAIERLTDISQNSKWSSSAYNDEQDKTYLLLQDLKRDIRRALRIPLIAEVDSDDISLPPESFANFYLAFDSNGKPTPAALSSTTVTKSVINALLYPQTTLEAAVSAVVVNTNIPDHTVLGYVAVDRYGLNLIPGTTDMSTALQAAINVALRSVGIGKQGLPVRFYNSAYKIVTIPTFGAGTQSALPIDIGGVGPGTQIINAASAGKPTFDMTGRSGYYLHDVLLTGNSSHPNDGIWANKTGASNLGIRWRIERVITRMAGKGILVENANTGVIRDCKNWPDDSDNLLTVAQTVTQTDIDHGIHMSGDFCHDISIYDFDGFPRDSFKTGACGIKCDATGPNSNIVIVKPLVQGNSGMGRFGIKLQNCNGFFIQAPYFESSVIQLLTCSAGTLIGSGTGGVEGKLQLASNSEENTIIGVFAKFLDVNDSTCTKNTFIGCYFTDATTPITDAAAPKNRYINVKAGHTSAFTGYDRGGTPWTTVAYSASMTPDCTLGHLFNIVPNNNTNFVVNSPSTPNDGEEVTIKIRNSTGSTLGTLTWDSEMRAASTTQPLDGHSIIRKFVHDKSYGSGVLWVQSGADVNVLN